MYILLVIIHIYFDKNCKYRRLISLITAKTRFCQKLLMRKAPNRPNPNHKKVPTTTIKCYNT